MARPATKTVAELQAMNDDQLFTYYRKHAGFMEDAPNNAKYSINVGSKSLISHDTADLYAKFKDACRKIKTLREQVTAWYMEYFNDFITVEKFAEHHGLNFEQAKQLIELGKSIIQTPHPDA